MMPLLALERRSSAQFAVNGSTAKPEEGLVSGVSTLSLPTAGEAEQRTVVKKVSRS
jgi:hypothetical protein